MQAWKWKWPKWWPEWPTYTWHQAVPILAVSLIICGALTTLWLIIHVELGGRFSLLKTALAIILLSLFYSFGLQLFLIFAGL